MRRPLPNAFTHSFTRLVAGVKVVLSRQFYYSLSKHVLKVRILTRFFAGFNKQQQKSLERHSAGAFNMQPIIIVESKQQFN